MTHRGRMFAAGLLVLLAAGGASAAPGSETAPDFTLRDAAGVEHSLSSLADRKAVVVVAFTAGCPILRRTFPTLRALADDYGRRGVAFLYIDPAPQDDPVAAAAEAKNYGVVEPILIDRAQDASAALGFTRSAETVVIRPKDRRILYRGAADERLRYEGARAKAGRRYLAEALDAALAGREPATPRTRAFGCFIDYSRRDATKASATASP